jgi:virginiamycin B lyase
MWRTRWLVQTTVGAACAVLVAASPVAASQSIHETHVPTPNSGPFGITQGPGGSIWFTESYADAIGVRHRDGTIDEFDLPAGSMPEEITEGSDHNLWFTMYGADAIGRMTPRGHVTSFPTPTEASGPFGITTGPDGNVWFTESATNVIGKVTPKGAFTEYPLDPGFNIEGITAGPDGALWFTRFSNPDFPYPGFIGRITTSGSWTEQPSDGIGDPLGIVAGPDGNLWVTGPGNDTVAKVSTSFEITTYHVPGGALNVPYLITAGSDGALWFTENGVSEGLPNVGGNKIGRITTDGHIRQWKVPTGSSEPSAIAPGPHRTIWFAEQAGDNLGRLTADG